MEQENNYPKIYSIEGNIGSGKSTIINILKEHFKTYKNVVFLLEPVDEWNKIRNENDKTILECYYEDKAKYAFSFQMMAYITRINQLKKAIHDGYEYIITERSVSTDKNVFTKMLYDNKEIDSINYQIYNKLFDELTENIPQFKYIYVKTDPEIAETRVRVRSRKGESNISLEFLKKCNIYHELWLKNTSTMIINGNNNNDEIYSNEVIQLFTNYTKIKANEYYTLTFDGGSRGNPGKSGCGFILYGKDNNIITEGKKFLGIQTNNYAEYMGVITGLEKALELNVKHLIIKGDSLLIINQLKGIYNVNSENIKPLYEKAINIIKHMGVVEYIYIKRNLNSAADKLANEAMDNE
tara:strand:+ start:3155 stop:4213 length:1059 start_codon:yes stop_codon:yes gene_type:complete